MPNSHLNNGLIFLCSCMTYCAILLYIIHLNSSEHPKQHPKHPFPQIQHDPLHENYTGGPTDEQVAELFRFIDQKIADVPLVALNQTSSAKNSIATILNPPASFCVGDILVVRVEMYNFLGERRRWGGDYLHARIHSTKLGAGASGRVEDLNNGSYNVYFTLFWEGHVDISIILYHPTEGVSTLWRIRKADSRNMIFYGHFINNTKVVLRECYFHLNSQEDMCEYEDEKYGEKFYCYKPPGVLCEALVSMNTDFRPVSYLKNTEKKLFDSSNRALEIPKTTGSLEVLNCNRTIPKIEDKCKTGEQLPFPSGYYLKNQWNPVTCKNNFTGKLEEAKKCLSGKLVYLIGDSTLRQWIMHFPKMLKEMKLFDLHGNGWHQTFLALDPANNVYVKWRKHGHPFVSTIPYTVKDFSYLTNEIDQLAGGKHTVIVFTLGMHFRFFPLPIFIKRLLNVRKAIELLFIRSPDTKVIVKTENTREIHPDVERYSDFHGYVQYLLTKKIFSGLNVGMIDAFDMTIAAASYNVHPPDPVLQNQIDWFLSYIC